MSILKFMRFSSVALTVTVLLAGCGASIPDASDEEIITLLGDSFAFSPEDKSPLVVREYVVECANLLSGVNADTIKDLPAATVGERKTACREALDEKIKDASRNAKNFKLEHFENKDFAKRLAQVAESSKAAYDAYEAKRLEEIEKRRAEEQAQRRVEAEQKLAAARAEFERSLEGYEALADEVVALCTEIGDVITALQERGQDATLSGASGNCQQNKQDLLQAAEDNRAIWAAVEIRENMDTGFREPHINVHGAGTNEGLERMISSLKSDLSDMKNRL